MAMTDESVRTIDGVPLTPPAGGRLRPYSLRITDGIVEIEIN